MKAPAYYLAIGILLASNSIKAVNPAEILFACTPFIGGIANTINLGETVDPNPVRSGLRGTLAGGAIGTAVLLTQQSKSRIALPVCCSMVILSAIVLASTADK